MRAQRHDTTKPPGISAQVAYEALFNIFPNAQVDTDFDGQVIIYTNMQEVGRDGTTSSLRLVEMDEVELLLVVAAGRNGRGRAMIGRAHLTRSTDYGRIDT